MHIHSIAPSDSRQTTYDAAASYAARGWSLIPLRPNTKEPLWRWKPFTEHRAGDHLLRRWFLNDDNDIGLIFGAVSGEIGCMDFDDIERYRLWAAARPDLASMLPTAATPRPGGGRHVYFSTTADEVAAFRQHLHDEYGRPVGNGAVPVIGGELRIGNSYACLPPSRGRSWVIPLCDELPSVPLCDPGWRFLFHHEGEIELRATPKTPPFHTNASVNQGMLSGCGGCVQEKRVLEERASSDNPLFESEVEKAIRRCTPQGHGERNESVRRLAQTVRRCKPEATDEELREIVAKWHRESVNTIRTKNFGVSLDDFMRAWERARHVAKLKPLWDATLTSPRPSCALQFVGGRDWLDNVRLVALCKELARLGGGLFFLGCKAAGELMGKSHASGARRIKKLVTAKIVEVVHEPRYKTGEATVYRYLGD